ncbi:MAG TPA: phosphatase PAP2 family protein [Caldimonas sp.]|nr:phosphatase PAP2 family protein [Caldimonas sp.]
MSGSGPSTFWHLVTRLGEAQIVLPAAILTALALFRRPQGRSLSVAWMGWLFVAVVLTTATKVAFIGWGVGWAALDFTGISGHAMFSSSIYPVLLGASFRPMSRRGWWIGVAIGVALALLIGVSRVVVGAHSVSEVVAGLLLGFAVSAASMRHDAIGLGFLHPLLPVVIALWLVLTPTQASASRTHSAVTRLSLLLSGHARPFTRRDLLRRLHPRPTA